MYYRTGMIVIVAALAFSRAVAAQDTSEERDALKIAAIEALMSAPPERALPAVTKVLQGEHSDDVKEAALFILSQLDSPEAQAMLLDMARNSDGDLREEAIEMIGIGGDRDALAGLREIYAAGDNDVREAVLEAYLIAGDSKSISQLALEADNPEDREEALETLAAMGAIEELRELMGKIDETKGLIEGLGIAGDVDTLRGLAMDGSNPERQIWAIEALGIADEPAGNDTLVQIYKDSDDWDVKEAALEGMLIAGHDEGMLQLYRESTDVREKRELLEYLSAMGSDGIWDIVDEALENRR